MRPRLLFLLAAGLAAVTAARAQLGGPGSSPGTTLAQFQPGLSPRASNLDLAPGQTVRLALYCADLFADTPTDRVSFTTASAGATVMMASGREVTLGEAIDAGLVHARGRGPADPIRREGGLWLDAYLANTTAEPLHVFMPAGTLLVPAGQLAPDVGPGIRRLFAAAQGQRLLGSDTLAHAVWATRGFSREDVEETAMTRLPDQAARGVQELLAAADLGYDFSRRDGDYARLYEERRAGLGEGATPFSGSAILPNGKNARAELVADAAGDAVVTLAPAKGGAPLYYAGRIVSRRPDRLAMELLHLKSGRPLEAARGSILVKLASG